MNNSATLDQLQFDRGLHYGDGLFETIAIKSGKAELLTEHINRLKESCDKLKFINIDFLKITKEIEIKSKNITKGVLKLIVTRGIGGRGYTIPDTMEANYLILQYPWPEYSSTNWINGVSVKKCKLVLSQQPCLAGMKHLNRLENIIAKMELINSDHIEGILCDTNQNVIEATSSNIFIVKDKRVFTPNLNLCGVSGVMRDLVIKRAVEIQLKINIKLVPYNILLNADEIFLTNSIIGIWPVSKLNERIYTDFSVTRSIMKLLNIEYNE
ncbi:Aminodeoxychorismate lyase [hydrothermal vent metagenome]|uniref:aminodeoxychorismate lyase n=1 Tax=hydrothermal vent metagenome TaxID=652676 RepID=A0A3B0ZXX9_9ZZZZ